MLTGVVQTIRSCCAELERKNLMFQVETVLNFMVGGHVFVRFLLYSEVAAHRLKISIIGKMISIFIMQYLLSNYFVVLKG